MTEEIIKLNVGEYRVPVTFIYEGSRIFLKFKYNKKLLEEVKSMEGAKWHGFDEKNPKKIWSISKSARNMFQIEHLKGNNPYERYDRPILPIKTNRKLYKHQEEMVAFALARHYCLYACEMGTGKTLAAIEVVEHAMEKSFEKGQPIKDDEIWYVGPRSGVYAVSRELAKWKARFRPKMYTYESLVRELRACGETVDIEVPKIVIFDESSKVKTPTAQRSEAALHLANAIRETHGEEGFVILMSGTPAPKSPADWWNQCEVACPGFLKEGNVAKFKARMCVIEERQSMAGGVYPHMVTWLDDANKCSVCGQIEEHPNHATIMMGEKCYHEFKKSKNEVEYLYQRLQGLALVKFKKDCLDLPEKQYKVIYITPKPETLRAAKLIKAMSPRAITALTLLRELSDGFQYTENKVGEEVCPNCNGTGKTISKVPIAEIDPMAPIDKEMQFKDEEVTCDLCGGTATIPKFERGTDNVTSPKDEVFIDLLDEHEDVGRFVVFGGFTGTIDRLVIMARTQGWAVLRIDGRGFCGFDAVGNPTDENELLDAMDLSNPRYKELLEKYPKLTVISHPKSGGMAITLTASPTALYYSNAFDGEARFQSEDRIHRAGMDVNRSCTIIDLVHLPSDLVVLENLKKKKKLQDLSMNELNDAFANTVSERIT